MENKRAKPVWLRIRHRESPNHKIVEATLRRLNLNTVCSEACCPNQTECFSRKTATFMIMGTICTRNCRFCNVRFGEPLELDAEEPVNIAKAVKELGLGYVVITSVTRDDLPDGGAGDFAKVIAEVRRYSPNTLIEVLIPDFVGSKYSLKIVTDALPDVISHNVETVSELYQIARPQAVYQRSLNLLKNIKLLNPNIRTKSGFMVGLGETENQVYELFDDLYEACCEFLTIGQYLAPSKEHLPVFEYVEPCQFEKYELIAKQKGFEFVAAAPLVRSSFRAGEAFGEGDVHAYNHKRKNYHGK